MHRFLICHRRAITDEQLTALKSDVDEVLKRECAGQQYTLTLARDEWQQNFEHCGSWELWKQDVVYGVDFASGQQRYTGFISDGQVLGKATAEMLMAALSLKKPVVIFERGSLRPATRVVQTEAADPKTSFWIE